MKFLTESEFALAIANSNRGDAKASISLAEHHLALQFREQGKNYYLVAAKQGSSAAAGALATLCVEDGLNEEAVKWLKIACHAGNKLACTHLSIAYFGGGLDLIPDAAKAAEYGRLGDFTIDDNY
jgi:TPR repeat protein